MSRVPGWLGRLGAGLTELGERLDERRAEVEKESQGSPDLQDRSAVRVSVEKSDGPVPDTPETPGSPEDLNDLDVLDDLGSPEHPVADREPAVLPPGAPPPRRRPRRPRTS